MIYGDLILEQNFNKMTDPINIMTEYYENEISILEATIEYQNECTVTESYELETLHEGFIDTIKEKIKTIIKGFITFLKKISSIIRNKFSKNRRSETNSSNTKFKNYEMPKEENEEEQKVKYKYFNISLYTTLVKLESEVDDNCTSIMKDLDHLMKYIDIDVPNKRPTSDIEDLLYDSYELFDDKIDRLIDNINEKIKTTIPIINFNDYIEEDESSSEFAANLRFDRFTDKYFNELSDKIIKTNDKYVKECYELLNILNKKDKQNTSIDVTLINKITKTINSSITYLQKISSESAKTLLQCADINNKLKDEAMKKFKERNK